GGVAARGRCDAGGGGIVEGGQQGADDDGERRVAGGAERGIERGDRGCIPRSRPTGEPRVGEGDLRPELAEDRDPLPLGSILGRERRRCDGEAGGQHDAAERGYDGHVESAGSRGKRRRGTLPCEGPLPMLTEPEFPPP